MPLGGRCRGTIGATGFADVGSNRELVLKVAVLTEPEALRTSLATELTDLGFSNERFVGLLCSFSSSLCRE